MAGSGDTVRIIVTDHQDRRPVEDIVCTTDESYAALYRDANLQTVQVLRPLATEDEPYSSVNETAIAPWVIYVLRRAR